MARDEVPWLVKSSGRIMGPHPIAKIVELLRSREVSVLDEISAPARRWQTIQYHPDFKDIVDSLRRANVSDKTETTWTPTSATGNLTQTLTDITNGAVSSELTEEITGFTGGSQKEIVIHNLPEQRTGPGATPAFSGRFQSTQDQNTAIKRQVEKTTRGMWLVTGVILLAVAAFIVHKKMTRGAAESKPLTAQALKASVLADVQTGQYGEALRDLKAFYPDGNPSADMAIYYGSLIIQIEGQTVVGRRVLNSVIAARRPEMKQAYTSDGIADILDGNLDQAKENFERALAIDSQYVPALVNMAAVHLKRGDYARAKSVAHEALKLNPLQGEALLAWAEAQLYLYKSNANYNELNQVNKHIKEFRARHWDFASELGFYSLYFDSLKPDRQFDEKLKAYLDIDPELTPNHRHNVFIYKGISQWKVLGRLCEQMADKLPESARISAFLASCYTHEGRFDQARKSIEKAVQQSPKDALIQAWYSYILKENGDGNQASVVLGHATEFNRAGDYHLPTLLQARFCATNDEMECARESWQRLYERNQEYLPAVNGLAWVYARKGSRSEALKYLDRGMRISQEYIPLLELRQRAEKEGWYAAN